MATKSIPQEFCMYTCQSKHLDCLTSDITTLRLCTLAEFLKAGSEVCIYICHYMKYIFINIINLQYRHLLFCNTV